MCVRMHVSMCLCVHACVFMRICVSMCLFACVLALARVIEESECLNEDRRNDRVTNHIACSDSVLHGLCFGAV
jgi:hypothetical protein